MRFLLTILLCLMTPIVSAQTNVGPFAIATNGPARGSNSRKNLQMNASGEGVGAVFSMSHSGEIDQIFFMPSVVASSESCTVRVETIGTDGLPTGTLYDASASGGVIASQTADTTTSCTFASDTVTYTAGDTIAVIIDFTSFSSGDVSWACIQDGGVRSEYPLVLHDTGSGWAIDSTNYPVPCLCVHFTDGTYVVPQECWPPGRFGLVSIQSDTTPDELAFQFTAPVAMRVCGLVFYAREFGSTALIDFSIWDDGGTPSELIANPTSLGHNVFGINHFYSIGLEPESLTASQVVNVSIFNNDASNDLDVTYFEVDDADHWGDFATGFYYSTRTDAGAFTETTTRKLIGGLYFDQITASGGGIATDPIILP